MIIFSCIVTLVLLFCAAVKRERNYKAELLAMHEERMEQMKRIEKIENQPTHSDTLMSEFLGTK